jgi:hypothetical protein
MIRPLLGGPVIGSGVGDAPDVVPSWTLAPNPGTGEVRVRLAGPTDRVQYELCDLQGRVLLTGMLDAEGTIATASLVPGLYLVRLRQGGIWSLPQRWVKQ